MSATTEMQFFLSDKWVQALPWDSFVAFSAKNVGLMGTNYQNTEVPDPLAGEIKAVGSDVRVLAIGADWCGDAVANVPSIARLCDLNKQLQLRVIDRDRHDDLISRFLTNGGKAIPKVIVGSADFSRIEVWGPRPAPCQAIMTENKDKLPKDQIIPMLRQWYANDKYQTVLKEVAVLIKAVAGA